MAAFIDMAGERIGRLTAIERAEVVLSSGRKMPAWRCRCDCGTEKVVLTTNLRKPGHTTSCGCYRLKAASKRARTHGGSHTREYGVWRAMLDRCYNERDYHYQWYGARGISVCDRWRSGSDGKSGFECWKSDMGQKPTPKHSIDRIDNDGNYEPGNCRWATPSEQQQNKRRSEGARKASIYCRHGHPKFGRRNIYISKNGRRLCRQCQREASAKYYVRTTHASATA